MTTRIRVFLPNPSIRGNKEFLTELAGHQRAATRWLKTLSSINLREISENLGEPTPKKLFSDELK